MVEGHQYILRETGEVVTEKFIGDRSIGFLYHRLREHAPTMFRMATSNRMSGLLGYVHFDSGLNCTQCRGMELLTRMGIDWRECVAPPQSFSTPRQVFERQIRYWDCRPMDGDPAKVVSPADARILIGSLEESRALTVKGKLFCLAELLGESSPWVDTFAQGDFAVFRLTPDKYHYNHAPVSGRVVDIYSIDGRYHSCNPSAVVAVAGLYSKNRRVVTIIDTDVAGGARIGMVAMIEVVALMIGDIVQCYSSHQYRHPRTVQPGMMLEKGCPKSLYRPGSSTDILLFQKNAILFSADLRENVQRVDVRSRFSDTSRYPKVETDIRVRSTIAEKRTITPFPAPVPHSPRQERFLSQTTEN